MEQKPNKILVIDDDPLIRKIFSKFLTGKKFTVLEAENGREGLRLFNEEIPDLVLTDLRMPEMTGLDVIKTISEKSIQIPIIVVSGTDDIKEMVGALRYGAWDFVVKPVEDLGVLEHAVARGLERALLIHENERYHEKLEEEVKKQTRALHDELAMRKQMEQLLHQSLENLQRVIDGIINTISKIGDIRDPYTGGHQHRVAQLAKEIAEGMKLPEDQAQGIYIAGLLHDIGKISIPLEILSKPGEIADIEKDMIKIHPTTGFNILKEIEFPWPIHDIILQHHERLDGSGYPRGLKDGEILLEAKIIGVADVVEAIASHRPYRASLGMDYAMEEITSLKGVLYDHDVVDACVTLINNGFEFDEDDSFLQ